MADVVTTDAQDDDPGQKAAQDEPSLQDLIAELNKVKSAQSGSDRRVKELSDALKSTVDERDKTARELEEERKARMSEKERAEYERQKYEDDLKREKAEVEQAKRDFMITESLAKAKLSPEVRQLMKTPADEDGVSEWVKVFEDAVKKEADARVNAGLLANRKPPTAGDRTQGSAPLTEEELERLGPQDIKNMSEDEFKAFRRRMGLS